MASRFEIHKEDEPLIEPRYFCRLIANSEEVLFTSRLFDTKKAVREYIGRVKKAGVKFTKVEDHTGEQ